MFGSEQLSQDDYELYEERVAIMIHDGGLDEETAKKIAVEQFKKQLDLDLF